MAATNQVEGKTARKVYTSASAADTSWNTNPGMASWVHIQGVGLTVLVDESGNNVTLTTDAAEPASVRAGPWQAFTSTTATRVTMGNGGRMPPVLVGTLPSLPVGSLGPFAAIAVTNQATLSGLAQTIDGTAINTAGMRVYLAKQTTGSTSGAWVAQSGNWTRPADWASGATIPLGTQIQIAPGGTANFASFGSNWYVDTATDVVDTGTITAYPVACKGQATLTSASPSTVTVSSLWIKSATTSSVSADNLTTAANGIKAALTAGAGTGTLVLTGPNTVTDVVAWIVYNG